MSQQSMSIHQMIQQAPLESQSPENLTCPTQTFTGKVKIFYSVKGQDTNCLCSFDIPIDSKLQNDSWINVPLKKCLISVCSSCPDQLMHSSHDTAIYSANFEDLLPSHDPKDSKTLIWEGHGLLSNLLSNNNNTQVTGKLKKTDAAPYTHTIQVLIQLHPVHHRPHADKNINGPDSNSYSQTLPSMKLLLSEPDPRVGPNSDHYDDQHQPQSHAHIHAHNPNYTHSQNHLENFHGPHKLTTPNTTPNAFVPPLHLQDYSTTPNYTNFDPVNNNSNNNNISNRALGQSFVPLVKRPRLEDSPTSVSSSSSLPWTRPLSDVTNETDRIQPSTKRKQHSPARDEIMTIASSSSSSITAIPYSSEAEMQHSDTHSSAQTIATNTIPNNNNITNTGTGTGTGIGNIAGGNIGTVVTTAGVSATAKPSSHGKPYPSGNIKTLVDAYYHQSRRKKRDTKPPNTNDVRSYVEIDKNTLGMYILPAEVDSWTVLDLGKVVWDRASFHNQRYIYPVGYRVKKWYRSMVDSHSDTQYTCQILDGGDEPIFQLDADDNPGEVWRGPTPTTVWTIAVRRAFAIRNMDYGHNPVGPDFFGLRKNTIAKMIQDLPNADKCQNYIWQNFEATSGSRGKAMRRTSARVGSASSISSAGLSEPVSYVTSPPSRFSHNSPSTPSKAEPLSPNSETSSSEKSS
ncbi:hypothetical protein PHYBLDRAFT_59918 [Phycomyces blakesleeanus NRRL 1555(-)]|uniref:FYR N-terminal domain-containing protein n=1 Tax=Phycomyces blakesleeanus (strain ATCC 8743b / DSM 1359 / FGSC 10004 / NBRC 33097 / NRRL 1555) TaxID=763407 RepID=A0A162UI44_PHYB8|nr:hypothetical protein PHYBLDRAFT_59918 [Phycomyces blakesleeanus NRRL 1555(-)]OAD76382.1 hypothetical protein PHYBLDRAFT_59918 [Phycomyces blakesleeanus NRRL 1555(-)]|eukprot:XP_018294422.1 hypothetical protein PHYBLDRAFT_59918 [Phycomyces blakesleeanus NRRL 1555(-)]